jgi:hypothetical protein
MLSAAARERFRIYSGASREAFAICLNQESAYQVIAAKNNQ